VLTRRAVELIDGYAGREETFYLQLDYFAPHRGRGRDELCHGAAVPDAGDLERFVGAGLLGGRAFNEADVLDKPSFIRSLPPLTAFDRRRIEDRYRCELASLRAVDRGVDAVVEALRDADELDRTVILFTSDNGYYHGKHRIPVEKHFPYEEGIRVPLLIHLPTNVPVARRLRAVRVPTANIDLAPTILELARAEPCVEGDRCRLLDGRPLLPLLRRRSTP
jgi:arylsulfatase A-like enzyme